MEEARQHSALTIWQWAYIALLFGGVFALLLGIVLTFAIDHRSMLIAGAAWLATRIAMAMMRIAWPEIFMGVLGRRPSRLRAAVDLLVFFGLAIFAVSIWMK